MTESTSEQIYDLIVVGGGMVGSALACATAQAGFEVCVLEAREPQSNWPVDEVDLRVSALSRSSQCILENLDVWQRMTQMRVSPYSDMHVWDTGGSSQLPRPDSRDTGPPLFGGSIHFNAGDIGEPNLGHIVENRVTQLALWERLGQLPSATPYCPAMIMGLEVGDNPEVILDDGRRLQARLIIGADGRESVVRQLAAIATKGWDYDQHAIVATIQPQLHHQYTAWQHFMPSGPLALLPIDDGRCSIVWSTSPQQAAALMEVDDEAFCEALGKASEGILGAIRAVGPRGVFSLRLGHAETYIREGLALVGDAAHAIHPLAGQGVNLGFLDAACLAEVLIEARKAGRKLGSMANLRRYERARKGANMGMLGAMDFFKRVFSNDVLPVQLMRNLGLTLADHSGPLKQLMIRRAMGLTGERPTLAR